MGWWITDAEGNSLLREGDLWSGDAPADILGDAFDEIDREYEEQFGRKPSLAEIYASVRFVARVRYK